MKMCKHKSTDSIVLFFEETEAYLEEKRKEPPSKRLKGVLRLFIQFKENKAKLLKGVGDIAPKRKSIDGSPLYNQLHQIFVDLFEEINEKEFPVTNSIFRADMLLTTFASDFYLFQREVRGYSADMLLEQVYIIFVSGNSAHLKK